MDKDFSKVLFKVNTSGSWANLCTCPVERIEEVKKACEVIARGSHIRFKYLDAEGGIIEQYSYLQNGVYGYRWHEPKLPRGRL